MCERAKQANQSDRNDDRSVKKNMQNTPKSIHLRTKNCKTKINVSLVHTRKQNIQICIHSNAHIASVHTTLQTCTIFGEKSSRKRITREKKLLLAFRITEQRNF